MHRFVRADGDRDAMRAALDDGAAALARDDVPVGAVAA